MVVGFLQKCGLIEATWLMPHHIKNKLPQGWTGSSGLAEYVHAVIITEQDLQTW